MTTPDDSPQVFEGTDISVDPEELGKEETPATSDPEEMSGGDDLGGTGGENAGGAG